MSTPHSQPDPPPGGGIVEGDDAVIGRAFRWSLVVIVVAVIAVAVSLRLGRRPAPGPEVVERDPIEAPSHLEAPGADEVVPSIPFADVTLESGIDFVHMSGAVGDRLLPETMGAGVAALDYDGDGDQDLFFVNGTAWPGAAVEDGATLRLYRNDGHWRFADVTTEAGLDLVCYGQGVAVGDDDGDGDPDLYVTALGPNLHLRNEAGVFRAVTSRTGTAGDPKDWSTSAGFLDYDRDGHLDLFVCNYVQWSREVDFELAFTLNGRDRAYGPPKLYPGSTCRLFRNLGDGSYVDVTEAAGLAVRNAATGGSVAKALATTFVDLDSDGDLDILVANDTVQNFAFRNEGDGTFSEVGADSGFAFDTMGSATGAMGIDAGDYRNDGSIGIGIGNFANESTSFYAQQREPWRFADVANGEGVGSPSRLRLSFGLLLVDLDLDGRLDLVQANGHLEETINEIQPSQAYRQSAQVFWNRGPERRSCFTALSDDAIGALATPAVGRGLAHADLDLDGDLDLVLTQTGARPLVLRNDQRTGNRALRFDLGSGAAAIGAWVEVTTSTGTQRRQVMPTRSYLSQAEAPLTIGLGSDVSAQRVVIRWADGRVEEFADVPAGTIAR